MTASNPPNPLALLWLEHMDEVRGEGSCAQHFREYVYGQIGDRPDVRSYLDSIATDAAINKEWDKQRTNATGKKVDPDEPFQLELTIGGLPVMRAITYRDADMPGGHRTVLSTHASVYQLALGYDDHYRQWLDFGEKNAEYKVLRDAALERCEGDQNMLLIALTDDFFDPED